MRSSNARTGAYVSVNGERRSFALPRPIVDTASQERLRDVPLDAYKEHEAELAASAT